MRSRIARLVVVAALLAALPAVAQARKAAPSRVLAGVGVVDATWNVGASAGQYASDRPGLEGEDWADSLQGGEAPDVDPTRLVTAGFDPNVHSVKRKPSYGVESRLTVRAIVVQGPDGPPVALLKSDNYLAQDLLVRRVGQLLEAEGSRVRRDHILYSATHNHSSPYYTTAAAGVWAFQDAMDLRMLEYQARAMAQAIRRGEENLRPVRMSATTVQFGKDYRNAPGGAVADDGSPAGYPQYENDAGLVVVRFDDVSRKKPKPLAVWMNYGVHPESLDGYDLITGDFVSPLERYVERDIGAPVVFSQGGVGSSEPANDTKDTMGPGVVRAFSHYGYAQAERHARLMADKVVEGFNIIGADKGDIPWTTDFPVAMFDGWVPGPVSHPYPAVSNCRTEPTVEGNPGAPVVGLPDCARPGDSDDNAAPIFESLKMHGLPIPNPPEHYDAPSFGAVEENLRIHLQAVRLGDILLASCSCEPQVDLIKNLESRTDAEAGNIYDGFDWSPYCDQQADETWKCPNPGLPESKVFDDRSLTVTDAAYRRMVAQVRNDAAGWDAPEYAPFANAEPTDPAQIKGNFTKEEVQALGAKGYKLTVGLGHTGDYNGYVVSYRNFMSFDHYRKALTAYGPHTADYMVTRLVRMAAALQGAPLPEDEPLAALATVDESRQDAQARVLGQASAAAFDGWHATLPDDLGQPEALTQPTDITRFDAATFTWRGGNNDVDQPLVRVERLNNGRWKPYANQTGEVQTVLQLPEGVQSLVAYRANQQEWKWTANFEAADWFPRNVTPDGQVPTGLYRFAVAGHHRSGQLTKTYHLTSAPFAVRPWEGVAVADMKVEPGGAVSFTASSTYPRTYESDIDAIGDDELTPICKTCTFRPWASASDVKAAMVTVRRASGAVVRVPAHPVNDRWVADAQLAPGDTATVERGAVVDSFGEINGVAAQVTR
ncbi:MAG: hypothetical protein QOG87_276 [Actinomycetota bacterium]